jgi:hypothetical protein
MNFEDLAIGWREALLGAVALLVLYVFIAFFRLRRLRRLQAAANVAAPVAENTGENNIAPSAAPAVAAYAEASFPWNEPPETPLPSATPAAPVADDRRLKAAEAEIADLRDQVSVLRGELAALREDVKLKVERVQASHNVAPIYGDAMQMAVAGYDAAAIAERCGVARAEAELVVALIRNREDAEPKTMRER